MIIPDIIGLKLGEARKLLENSGVLVTDIVVTCPPREKLDDFDDQFRVIRTKITDGQKLELLVCKPL